MSEVSNALRSFYDQEMKDRAIRPLGEERLEHVRAFAELLRRGGASSVLEVGCGAGRDGEVLSRAGVRYVGVDLTPAAVRTCHRLGLDAIEAVATDLPFADDSFDAAWSMSTLMHLPADGFGRAVGELRRVLRSGGVVEIGVWGHTRNREWTKPDGRYFKHRTDEQLKSELEALGTLDGFDTWDWFDDGGHYQWARVITH